MEEKNAQAASSTEKIVLLIKRENLGVGNRKKGSATHLIAG